MVFQKSLYIWTALGVLSFVRICLSTGWIIPVYDVRSQERFAFAEDFLRLILLEQSEAVGGQFLEYALAPLDKEGYIINEDGQVVPFKIFKKGMCFLHPRNCRGGFHKRLTDEPGEQESDSIYNFRVSKRGSSRNPMVERRQYNKPKYRGNDDDIFQPTLHMQQQQQPEPEMRFTPEELRLLRDYSLVKSEPVSRRSSDLESYGNINEIRLPTKQSRTVDEFQKLLNRKYGLNDRRSYASLAPFSSDSSLSLGIPVDATPLRAYSFIPEGSFPDLTNSRTSRARDVLYDAIYPVELGRRR